MQLKIKVNSISFNDNYYIDGLDYELSFLKQRRIGQSAILTISNYQVCELITYWS